MRSDVTSDRLLKQKNKSPPIFLSRRPDGGEKGRISRTENLRDSKISRSVRRRKQFSYHWRPHTRIVRGWQKAFKIVLDYIYLNQIEAEGFISRKETKTLKDYRAIFQTG